MEKKLKRPFRLIKQKNTAKSFINIFEGIYDFSQAGSANAQLFTSLKFCIQVCIGQVEIVEIQDGLPVFSLPYGVGFGTQMSPGAISVNEFGYLYLFY